MTDKGQADLILAQLSEIHPKTSIQISTVDAFQGAEKPIIILSTVRTQHIGFINDPKRVNVALTRSKRHLIIFGNYDLLNSNRLWGQILSKHCLKGE